MSRVAQSVYTAVREGILRGDHALGSRLGEEDLALSLGVSRTPVREALKRLSAEGLVEVLPNRGARVAIWKREDLDEIFHLRDLLESYAAGLAAQNASPGDLEHLDSLVRAMNSAGRPGAKQDLIALSELNTKFHGAVVRAAGSRRLVGLVDQTIQVPLVLRTFHSYTPEALERSLHHHAELVVAIRAREPEWASAIMRAHIRAARGVRLQGSEE